MEDYEYLENLMLQDEFASLNITEQQWVEQFMSSNEFNEQRSALLNARKTIHQSPSLPSHLEVELMATFRKHHHQSFGSISKIAKPLAIGIGMIMCFILGRWSTDSKPQNTPNTSPTIIIKTIRDTILLEKTIPTIRTIIKEKITKDTIYINNGSDTPIAFSLPEIMPLVKLDSLPNRSSKVVDDQQIYDILVDVY